MPTPEKMTYTFRDGRTVDLYYIGTLAAELGRSVKTIRQWEIAGTIPKPPFYHIATNRRLYTWEHIMAIVSCAERAKICNGRPIPKVFSPWCQAEFRKLADKYDDTGGSDNA